MKPLVSDEELRAAKNDCFVAQVHEMQQSGVWKGTPETEAEAIMGRCLRAVAALVLDRAADDIDTWNVVDVVEKTVANWLRAHARQMRGE